jgi:CYTH domain-containing protein
MLEIEKTYLVKFLPEDLKNCDYKELIDIYIPESSAHPDLRIRKNGDKYEITRKRPIDLADSSRQDENTISLSKEEFEYFNQLSGKRVRKIRYLYEYNNFMAEFDLFQDNLKGLVLADFEFKSDKEKDIFIMPNFCLAEVTEEVFIAGGVLAGKGYKDIEKDLKRFNYKKIF